MQGKRAAEMPRGIKAAWGFFGSMKIAFVLFLLLAAASVLGTVIRQNASPEVYISVYGEAKYALLRSLGLTDLYHSAWYILILAFIGLSLVVCSISRFGGKASLYAARGRIAAWGPYLVHLSVLIIFAGAILGSRLGFKGYTAIAEGGFTETCRLQDTGRKKDLGFRVVLRKFTIEHDEDHNATGYKSDLAVYDHGRLAAEKVIDVNHPLTYRGVSFLQSDYGLDCFVIKVRAPTGETAWLPFGIDTQNGPHGKQYIPTDTWLKQVTIGGKKFTVFVHNLAPDYVGGDQVNASFMPINPAAQVMVSSRFPDYKGLDAWSNLGWLTLSQSVKRDGFTITMEDIVDYTDLQVVKNPGLPIIYAGFGLILIGVFISFYAAQRSASGGQTAVGGRW